MLNFAPESPARTKMLNVPDTGCTLFGKICAKTNDAPRSLLALDATADADHHRFPLHLDLESSARALCRSCHVTLPLRGSSEAIVGARLG
jgi:hypothetical protein